MDTRSISARVEESLNRRADMEILKEWRDKLRKLKIKKEPIPVPKPVKPKPKDK